MQKNNGGLDFLAFSEKLDPHEAPEQKEVYLVLQRSVFSQTTRLEILSAEEYLRGVPDWQFITTIPLPSVMEAEIFKKKFHESAKRGASSRAVFLEKVARERNNERFTPLKKLFKCTDEAVKFTRVDPVLQPGYTDKKSRTRKSKRDGLKKAKISEF